MMRKLSGLLILTFIFAFLLLSAMPLVYAQTMPLSYLNTFDQADTDRDGYLSFEEAQKSEALDETKFNRADTDSDNLLSLSEAKQTNLLKAIPAQEKMEEVLSERPVPFAEVTEVAEEATISPEKEKVVVTKQEEKPTTKPVIRQRRPIKPRSAISPQTKTPTRAMKGRRRPTRLFGGRSPRGTKEDKTSPQAETQNSEE